MSDTRQTDRRSADPGSRGPWPEPASRFPRGLRISAFAVLGAFGLLAVPVVLFGGLILFVVVGRVLAPPPVPEGHPLVLPKGAVVGTWRDDRGGRLLVGADGTFTSDGACGDFSDADLNSVTAPDSGSGSWHRSTSMPGSGRGRVTTVQLEFAPSAVWTEYEVRGTARRPVLWQYIGDPDDGELCVLRKES